MPLFELLLRPDLQRDSNASDIPPDVQSQQQQNQGTWMLDSRSLGIGIAIGIVLTVILASLIGLLSVSFRRAPRRSQSGGYRSRTTLPLTFSIPNLTTSKNRHVPAPAERLSLDSRMVLAHRAPSPELVLDIAPRKRRAPSPLSPSIELAPDSGPSRDLKEMRSMNTFSGFPTTNNAASTSTGTSQRPLSSPTSPGGGYLLDPFAGGQRQLHRRLSGYEPQGGVHSGAVRRVQSTGQFDHTADRKLAAEAEWERRRGMGHTLPRPEPAKTVPSRPGTGGTASLILTGSGTGTGTSGTWMGTENFSNTVTPFSSASSLGVHLLPSGAVSPTTTTTTGSASGSGGFTTVHGAGSQPNGKDHKRRRKNRSKSSLSKQPLSETHHHPLEMAPLALSHQEEPPPPPHHTHSDNVSLGLAQEDIAPPPYNVANVHSSRSRDRAGSSAAAGLDMGFGASHHARNHLL